MTHPKKERTFVAVKPDGVQRGLIGEVIARFERVGLKLVAMKMLVPDEKHIETFYTLDPEWRRYTGEKTIASYKAKGLRPPLEDPYEVTAIILANLKKYMTSGPTIAMVWEGAHAAKIVKKLTGGIPLIEVLFRGTPMGIDILTASVILSIMIIPFTASIARDSFNLTPSVVKESAYALGATKWEVVKNVVIPYSKLGVFGGIVLSLGRALGETMAVAFVLGNNHRITTSLLDAAFDALRPGSTIVLETINPACWFAFFESYIRDITHVRPIHPDTLTYLLIATGFQHVDVRYRAPYPEHDKLQPLAPHASLGDAVDTLNANVERLNRLLFTWLDYAASGRRP